MKKLLSIFSLFLTALLLFVACEASTASMPDTFWGLMSWHYTSNESGAYGVGGSLILKMKFTRTEGDEYEISGTADPFETTCTQYDYLPEACDPKWCKVTSVTSGTLAGLATVKEGTLTVMPRWDTPYDIHVDNMCLPASLAAVSYDIHPSQNEATVMESLKPTQEEPFFSQWTIDVTDITFIDELPVNEVTDVKTGTKNFSAAGIYSSGEGLLGLYRNEPQ